MTIHEHAPEEKLPRRRFLLWAWGASLLALAGQSLGSLLQFFKPVVEPGGFGEKVKAGRVDEFPVGSIVHVRKGRFYISRLDEGVLAMWHRCTHLGCTVPWRDDEDRFHCPCHGGIYNKKGEVLAGPPPRPLDLFPVEIVDGEIVVDTSRVITRDRFDPSQATPV
ncbi:MAG: Rieske 2Fe-2S domain-containing protein [Chloroflexi bacterium]|nr:Rieske 2Fe-2S domain-containing protein [Chloroflexota bacterium]